MPVGQEYHNVPARLLIFLLRGVKFSHKNLGRGLARQIFIPGQDYKRGLSAINQSCPINLEASRTFSGPTIEIRAVE